MGLLEVALAIGGLMGAGGKIASGIGQANASATDAQLKEQQAQEILTRNTENAAILQDKATQERAGYETGVAAQGSAMAGIGGELQIQKYTNEQISNATQEAVFNATMTRAGAAMEAQLGTEQAVSGVIGGVGSILTAGINLPKQIAAPSGTAPSLPTGDSVLPSWQPFGGP